MKQSRMSCFLASRLSKSHEAPVNKQKDMVDLPPQKSESRSSPQWSAAASKLQLSR